MPCRTRKHDLRNIRIFLIAVVVCLLANSSPIRAQKFSFPISVEGDREQQYRDLARDVQSLERELGIYKRVAKLVSPSVVHLEATPLPQYQTRRDVEEAGSGIIIRIRGQNFVLTNRHVIRHSDEENIRLELADGRLIHPTRILGDAETDVAILAVEEEDLLPARIGDSSKAEIGEIVLAFGSPFNLRRSVTRGIISAKGRSNLDLGEGEVVYQNFMQTDAAINPGNSGGPLVNLRGEVIGLNTAIASNSGGNDGIGFSIPINVVMLIANQSADSGQIKRGFLGVRLDGRFDSEVARIVGLPRLMGTRIVEITNHSPASMADLQTGDIILRYEGKQVDDLQHFMSLVKLTEIGRRVELVVLRNGELLTKHAHIGTQEVDSRQ